MKHASRRPLAWLIFDVRQKMKPITFWILVGAACVAGCAPPSMVHRAPDAEWTSLGAAEMKLDRTIVLRLRAETSDGARGEGYFVYQPSDPEYLKVLEHVGPLAPGQSVGVRPWPDKERPNKAPEPTTTAVTPRATSPISK